MQRAFRSALMAIAVVAVIAPAVVTAGADEDAYDEMGIVGEDESPTLNRGTGVRVIELYGPRSLRGDLRRGDVVLRLDGRRVPDRRALRAALDELGNGTYTLQVLRRGEIREIRIPRDRHARAGDRRIVVRDVIREALSDVRQNVREIRSLGKRDVIVLRDGRARLRDDRARLRESMQRLRWRLRELELDLDGRDWY